ncbi:MAG: polysaccharide biosynthesis protein [Gemmatimonadota bacterium]|nr:MAG: polysaccharide biosynthesis protein [Gemmatimonadota bacterium]
MDHSTTRVARHTVAYGLGSVVGGISRAILLPVVARTLAPDEYGVLSLLLAVTNFAHLVFELGLVTSLIRFHHATEDATERRHLRSLVFFSMPLIDLALAAPLLLGREWVSRALFGTPEHGTLVVLAIGIAFFAAQFQLFLGHLRADNRSRDFAILMGVKGVVSLVVTLTLVIGMDLGVAGFLLGTLAGPAVVAVVMIPRLLLHSGLHLERARARLRELFRFGLPLVPSALGLWILGYLDVYLLRVLVDLDSVGIYGFASEICLPIALLVTSIHLAWPTFSFERARKEGGPRELAMVFRHFFVVLTAGGLAVSVLRREILAILATDRYAAAADVIPLLALATVLYGAAKTFETGLQVAGNTRRLPLFVLFAAVVNAGLNVALIPSFREMGAAGATVITNVLLGVVVLRESNRQFTIPYEVGRVIRILVAAVAVFLVSELLPPLPWWGSVAARLALVGLFAPLLVPMRALSGAELRGLPGEFRSLLLGRGRL